MNDFFSELKRFVEMHQNEPTADLYMVWEESEIHLALAIEIYMAYFPLLEDYQAGNELRDEQRDFIRLLREENERLRGKTDE